MEYIPYNDLTNIQQNIIKLKLDNPLLSYNDWIAKSLEKYDVHFSPTTLVRFITKTALGYQWSELLQGGRNPYLNNADKKQLKEEVSEYCSVGTNYVQVDRFLEISMELKIDRLLLHVKFLRHINCNKLAANIPFDDEI